MKTRRLYLLPGIDPEEAARVLKKQIQRAENITPSSVGADSVFHMREEYVSWVEDTELQMHYLTNDHEAMSMLETPRYRAIREFGEATARPWPYLQAEIRSQTSLLAQLLEDLEARVARARMASGAMVVLDTNTLVEYQPPDSIPWPDLLGVPAVRLILPLRVVEELDSMKYSDRARRREKVRRVIPQLKAALGPGGEPREICAGVTLEVAVDPGPRRRPVDADEEVLATCEELGQLSGAEVSLASADIAIQLRAAARSIDVVGIPEKYRRNQDPSRSG